MTGMNPSGRPVHCGVTIAHLTLQEQRSEGILANMVQRGSRETMDGEGANGDMTEIAMLPKLPCEEAFRLPSLFPPSCRGT